MICPICNYQADSFDPFGMVPRLNARCPGCGALERHRLMWLYFREHTNLFMDKLRVLHFSPNKSLGKALSILPDYTTADIEPGRDLQIDMQDIPDEIGTFDVIIASHVLEHVADDRKAMRELYRILNPGGWAILQVPIIRETTFEDSAIVTPDDRLRHYGAPNHLRAYGEDYPYRLAVAGFSVILDHTDRLFDRDVIARHGLSRENIYYCTKPEVVK